jgi:hypothetical protein
MGQLKNMVELLIDKHFMKINLKERHKYKHNIRTVITKIFVTMQGEPTAGSGYIKRYC